MLGHAGCSLRDDTFWNLGYRLAYETHGRGVASRVAEHAVIQAQQPNSKLPVVAYLLEHNRASARVAETVGLTLRHRGPDAGNSDPETIRLVYSDRELSEAEMAATMR